VQLMGPANSEPLLVSLAAELEALGGWAAKQPAVWWNTGTDTGTDTPPVSSGPALR
jgi:amidase